MVAREAPRGAYPRGFSGEQTYWTIVGVDGDAEEALVSEDGAVEVGERGFTIEPFVHFDDKLWTWADVTAERHPWRAPARAVQRRTNKGLSGVDPGRSKVQP